MKKIRTILLIGLTLIFTAGCSFENFVNLDSTEEENTEIPDENIVTTPEENIPSQDTPTTPSTPSTEENEPIPESKPSNDEKTPEQTLEYLDVINKAIDKTASADSVYFTRKITGIFSEDAKIKFSKSQNRRWYLNEKQNMEEYLEGFTDRYTTDFNPSKYYYQTYWHKNNETNTWEKQGTIHASFGISELGFLKEIKAIKKLGGSSPYDAYVVTIDQNVANEAAANILNTPNMFKEDMTLTVIIDREGYIRGIDGNWKKAVLNDSIGSAVTLTVHMGDFNTTKIDRPRDLNDQPVDYPNTQDELTPNKKEDIKNKIYQAFQKTYKVNNATYNRNGKIIKYDIQQNSALMENLDGTITYYEGTPGKYVDYDFVTNEYRQDSWTKAKDSDIWTKNVLTHTCFIPRELYFLNYIFDVTNVLVEENMTTYTVVVLKQNANSAYSYSYDERSYSYEVDKSFTSNITFTVSINDEGYITEIHIDQEGYKLDLTIEDINSTNVVKPTEIK